MAHLVSCPVCEGTEYAPLADGRFKAGVCAGCGLGVEYYRPANPAGAYSRAAYDRAREAGSGSDRWGRFQHDTAVAVLRLDQVARLLPGPGAPRGVWVDVGCGSGAHLTVARRRGWSVVGVEADEQAAREVSELLAVPTLTFAQWAALQAPADVVSFYDTLEHLWDPVAALRAAADRLRPGGLLVVEAPDLDSTTPEEFSRGGWRHRRVSESFVEHLWHFSKASLRALAARHLPDLVEADAAVPVPTKLRVAWSKAGRPAPTRRAPDEAHAREVARQVAQFDAAGQASQLRRIKEEDTAFYFLVNKALTEFRNQAG